MLVNNAYHLTYCTNIHPGATWESTFRSLKEFVPGIKKKVAEDTPFGLGLRLSNRASVELQEGENLTDFKQWLQQNNVYVFTMNGFPYGNFHGEKVKDNVHAPDWTTRERVAYTKRLFIQLAQLIPEGIHGGISTSPITYKYWHNTKDAQENAFRIGARHLVEVALQLIDIEKSTGKYLHLDIEPEPDGLLENSDEVVRFYEKYLVPIGVEIVRKNLKVEPSKAEDLIKRHLTVCYDICHFSMAFEEPENTFKKFSREGILVGKIQVSAALKIIYDQGNMEAIWNSLARFDEPTYLHQVTEKVGANVQTYNDLPIVLEEKKDFTELRAHFHVPIFLERFGHLFSTQDHIIKVIDYVKKNTVSEHLEIETYTWDVLPEELKRDLSESIVREISWLQKKL